MDDWNDFGNAPLGPPIGPSARNPASASRSTMASASSSSFAHLEEESRDDSNTAGPSGTHGEHSTSVPERSSFLSSIPFLSSSLRRSTRGASPVVPPSTGEASASNSTEHARSKEAPTPPAPIPAPAPQHTNTEDLHPIDRPRLADRNGDDIMDHMSAASESDAGEPPSVMMSARRRRTTTDTEAGEDDASVNKPLTSSPAPRHGALDDVPDDFELNIEGFRYIPSGRGPHSTSELGDDPHSSVIASSLLRHPDKCYTKLEVISARQIRSLIVFFNVFILISIALATFMLAQVRNKYRSDQQIILPSAMFTDEERKKHPSLILPSNAELPQPDRMALADYLGVPEHSLYDDSFDSLMQQLSPHETRVLDDKQSERNKVVFSHFHQNYVEWLSRQTVAENTTPTQSGADGSTATSGSPGTGAGAASGGNPPAGTGTPGANGSTSNGVAQNPLGNSTGGQSGGGAGGAGFGQQQIAVYVLYKAQVAALPAGYQQGVYYMTALLSALFIFLAILYGVRIVRAKRRNITHEQIWVFVLIIVVAMYLCPVQSIIQLIKHTKNRIPNWLKDLDIIFGVYRDLSFSLVSYFYVWASLHSFRILDPTKRLEFRSFYWPKILVLVPYGLYHVLAVVLSKLWLTEIPLLSGVAFAYVFGRFRVRAYLWSEMWLSVFRSLLDLSLIILIVVEAVRTMRVLERAPYMKHRSKRVGFRFFLFMTFTFYALFIIEHALHLFLIPKGTLLATAGVPFLTYLRVDVFWYLTPGPTVLLVGYVLVTAHVYLPYTSVGWFKGWFTSSTLGESSSRWSFTSHGRSEAGPSMIGSEDTEKAKYEDWGHDDETPVSLVDNDKELQQQIVEPITYRKRESKDSLELKANCFTMQTHVIMFNFAWYVYYYGTPKLDNFRPKENPLPFEFRIDTHIKSQATDTQALVLDCTDRIIVAFKGTTSMKNLKTSLQMNQARLSTVIRYNADGDDEFTRLRKLFGQNYLWGKLHRGFAIAYLDVADDVVDRIRALRSAKKRAVFLTGHSLGGALATICSLDLWVKLNVSRREIFVSTFGSPRVGNMYFSSLYKEVVPLHWRIVVDPDMIAKMPRVGYTHVGKKVVLTPHGEMIIDPSALEQRPWTGESAGFVYHRKASYMLAMRAWCVRNHGMTYTPVFWPFPVRPDDERRFASAFDEGGVNVNGGKVAAKIIRMDAMVDALGDGTELDNMAVVEKWGRLTRRVLLNDKLSGTA